MLLLFFQSFCETPLIWKLRKAYLSLRKTWNNLLRIAVNAGTNKQHAPTRNTAKLDRETEELKHKSIDNSVARIIQQGRQTKGLSQKDLATKINEKPQIVNDYEAGRYVTNESLD